ncbi:MAG: hypothetical protein K0R92_2656 [Lachnospiraceae bacterium]|jgi:mannose-6-phosphate isomerase-like protein (cupin superfamily)|nr:hypothetical protein [Lachnospiraceae bacterium]
MIKRVSDYTIITNSAETGLGNFEVKQLMNNSDLPPHMCMFAIVTIKPGEECRYHKHEGDSEIYFIISGKAEYCDEGVTTLIGPGDTTCTYDGQSHSIRNISDTDLIFAAVIPYTA